MLRAFYGGKKRCYHILILKRSFSAFCRRSLRSLKSVVRTSFSSSIFPLPALRTDCPERERTLWPIPGQNDWIQRLLLEREAASLSAWEVHGVDGTSVVSEKLLMLNRKFCMASHSCSFIIPPQARPHLDAQKPILGGGCWPLFSLQALFLVTKMVIL